ncbi:hypothetical protein T190_28055 [Sinorhizobium meliloti CCBAU 01290]|nr:hypothetical protein T190_28055 [Sinorhizobium meliloti CCBAU 01290]
MRSGFPSGISKAKGLGIQGKAEMLQHAPAPSLAFPGIPQFRKLLSFAKVMN